MKNGSTIKILEHLRSNSRASIASISRATGLSRSVIFRRIKVINKHYVIKYTSIVHLRRMGYKVRAVLFLKSQSKKLMKFLYNSPNLNSIFALSGKYNLLVDTYFKKLSDYDAFERRLARLCKDMRIHFVVDEIKEEEFLWKKLQG